MSKIKAIAYYLPQYHPIPENDKWWGTGFTEWTNVTKAKPLFEGHKQPHFPSDLGYYDLRVPEVRERQAELARKAGIEGFCYWHYWFGNGTRLLERPFKEVLESGKPDFPFCLAWANESWSGIWHGESGKILMKQEYPGLKDYEDHFYAILPAFKDKRYIQVDGKPLFIVYNPNDLPDMKQFCDCFNELAIKNGLGGFYLVANSYKSDLPEWDPEINGFNAYTISAHNQIMRIDNPYKRIKAKKTLDKRIVGFIKRKVLDFYKVKNCYPLNKPDYIYSYQQAMSYFLYENKYKVDLILSIITGWDNSPRSGSNALILTGFTPDLFRTHIRQTLEATKKNRNKIVFIKSWNEWAEGNYLEPEKEYGHEFLKILKQELNAYSNLA